MRVNLSPELEKKLNDWAAASGRPVDELVEGAIAGLFDELATAQEMLDGRYDDIRSGRVKLIPGRQVLERLQRKSAMHRRKPDA